MKIAVSFSKSGDTSIWTSLSDFGIAQAHFTVSDRPAISCVDGHVARAGWQ
ncbi:hypothetical protein ABZ916_36830 [Streptomyces sp. NPDC046853]|uniref:hypothetical protein n=1 Tax=Streptomyces sp. NPDC046853 TaxID=3154920 RepID=UPI0033CFD468